MIIDAIEVETYSQEERVEKKTVGVWNPLGQECFGSMLKKRGQQR